MNNMNGIVLAVYASFFLAISQAALKKSFRDLDPSISFFFNAVLGIAIWIPLAIFFGASIAELPQTVVYAIISGILAEGLVFYALSKGQLSITSTILASYPVYTIVSSYFINNERLSLWQLIFAAVTIVGTLISYLPSKFSWDELKKSGAIFWPVIAAFGAGFSDTLAKHVINATSSFSFLLALALVQLPIALIYLWIEKHKALTVLKDVYKNAPEYKFPLLGSVFNIVGTGFLLISFNYTLASLASPITATSGVILVLLATIFMDEKIRLKHVLGIIMVLVGILGISSIQ